MPNLPALPPVTQAQLDRLVAVFPGDTLAEKADAYKAWSINNLIDLVERVEGDAIKAAAQVEVDAKMEALRASLPARVPTETAPVLTTSPTIRPIMNVKKKEASHGSL